MEKTLKSRSPLQKHSVITALGISLCILCGFLLICNMAIIIKGTVNPEKPPAVFGMTPMVVLSGSMSGEADGHIETGDLIFTRHIEPEALKTGDVIAYMDGSTVVTHRITAISATEDGGLRFTTKGDANTAEDTEPVSEEQIVGIYSARLPKMGDFVLFLQKPLGMLIFIGVPLLAFIAYDIVRRQRYAHREQEKTQELEAELARLRSLTDTTHHARTDPSSQQ